MEKLIIQSDKKNLFEVEKFVGAVCDTFNINNYAGTITMSVLQAAENAIVHGNGCNLDKMVTIVSDYCRGGVRFTVTDEGEGFNYALYGEMPEKEGEGTGLYLMKTLSDRIVFSDGGRTVSLEFFIDGIDGCRTLERIATLHRFYAPKTVHA